MSKINSEFNNDFSITMVSSVTDLEREKWDAFLRKENLFLQTDYLEAMELSEPAGMLFRYVILFHRKKPVGCFYFQVVDIASRELGSVINLKQFGGMLGKLDNHLNKFLFGCEKGKANFLVTCGNNFISGPYGLASGNKNNQEQMMSCFPYIIDAVKKSLEGERVVGYIVKDFYEPDPGVNATLSAEGFYRLKMDPNMIFFVDGDWKTFEDYLEALSAKYRLRANNAIKKIKEVKIEELSLSRITVELKGIEKLYNEVQNKAPLRLARVNSGYFIQLKKKFKSNFIVLGFYLDDKLIAFTSGFHFDDHYEAHFIGLDYHYNQSHALYQNILYRFITDAIQAKAKFLYFGRTAMEIKSTVGARGKELSSYMMLSNRLVNRIVKPFVQKTSSGEWIQRNPFKKEEILA